MGALQLSPEIEKADAEDQQCPAGMEAHGTVAEVCVAAGLLGVIHVLMDIRTGKCACFCHGRLLAWGCVPGSQAVATHGAAGCRLEAVSCGTTLVTLQGLSWRNRAGSETETLHNHTRQHGAHTQFCAKH